MTHEHDQQSSLERRAREVFDDSLDSLDAAARASLARARRAAVELVGKRRRSPWRTWVPAAALASAALVAVLLLRMPGPQPHVAADAPAVDVTADSVELLADGEDLDIVQNDLAFYEWANDAQADPGGSSG